MHFKWKYPIKLRIEIIPDLSLYNLLRKNKLQIKTKNVNESYFFSLSILLKTVVLYKE